VILAKSGKPVAKIVSFDATSRPHVPGAMAGAGQIWIATDFDEFPDDFAEAFGILKPKLVKILLWQLFSLRQLKNDAATFAFFILLFSCIRIASRLT